MTRPSLISTRVRHIGLIATATGLLAGSAIVGAVPAAAADDIQIGDCLMVDDAWDARSTYAVVECSQKHNGEVYDIVAYPADLGAPSTLTEDDIYAIEDECSWEAFDAWLGAEVSLPLRVWSFFSSLPSDEQWEAGAREVACRAARPTAKDEPMTYAGALPEIFASTPLLQWLSCTKKTPKSGAPNPTVNCTSKSKNLLVGAAQVKGKLTAKYPKDLQKAADKACGSLAKKYGKKGTKPVAALLPKDWVDPSSIFTECFVPLKSWNGKSK